MKNLFFAVLIFTSSAFAFTGSDSTNGSLFIIGGGNRPDYMMKEFVNMAGVNHPKIIVFPQASGNPLETAEYQVEQLNSFGAEADFIYWEEKTIPDSLLFKLDDADGIFFSGGDQRRLAEYLLNTIVLERIKKIYFNGGVIGGTSAGAAVMSSIMITGDEALNNGEEKFINIQKDNIVTSEGFGFVKNAIIDQHFLYRKRNNRLISLVLEYPQMLGIGIDESTAIIFDKTDKFRVLGEGQVVVYYAGESENIKVNKSGLFSAENIKMDILFSGCIYDFVKRKIIK